MSPLSYQTITHLAATLAFLRESAFQFLQVVAENAHLLPSLKIRCLYLVLYLQQLLGRGCLGRTFCFFRDFSRLSYCIEAVE
jgi:hypothetical protein